MEEKKRYWEGNICVGPDTASDITTTSGSTVQQVLNDHEERIDNLEAGFELIEEITLEEDVTSFERVQTPDSKNYNFKKVIVNIEATASTSGNRTFSFFNGENEAQTVGPFASTIKQYSISVIDLSNGMNTLFVSYGNYDTVKNNQVKGKLLIANSIDKIKLDGGFATGTIIKIYGIWA